MICAKRNRLFEKGKSVSMQYKETMALVTGEINLRNQNRPTDCPNDFCNKNRQITVLTISRV